jgi:hypothetical protein
MLWDRGQDARHWQSRNSWHHVERWDTQEKAPGQAGHRITYVGDPVVLQHLLGGQSLVGVHDQQLEE